MINMYNVNVKKDLKSISLIVWFYLTNYANIFFVREVINLLSRRFAEANDLGG